MFNKLITKLAATQIEDARRESDNTISSLEITINLLRNRLKDVQTSKMVNPLFLDLYEMIKKEETTKKDIISFLTNIKLEELDEYRQYKSLDEDSRYSMFDKSSSNNLISFLNKCRVDFKRLKSTLKKSYNKLSTEELDVMLKENLDKSNYISAAIVLFIKWKKSNTLVPPSLEV